jgi:hypothetical protein
MLWYEILTNENYFKNCKNFNNFALKFLNRSFNVVEVEVSSLADIDTKKRPLKHENAEKINFISTNGSHPLVSLNLVDDMLNSYFGKNCHFVLAKSKWFVSKTVDK